MQGFQLVGQESGPGRNRRRESSYQVRAEACHELSEPGMKSQRILESCGQRFCRYLIGQGWNSCQTLVCLQYLLGIRVGDMTLVFFNVSIYIPNTIQKKTHGTLKNTHSSEEGPFKTDSDYCRWFPFGLPTLLPPPAMFHEELSISMLSVSIAKSTEAPKDAEAETTTSGGNRELSGTKTEPHSNLRTSAVLYIAV